MLIFFFLFITSQLPPGCIRLPADRELLILIISFPIHHTVLCVFLKPCAINIYYAAEVLLALMRSLRFLLTCSHHPRFSSQHLLGRICDVDPRCVLTSLTLNRSYFIFKGVCKSAAGVKSRESEIYMFCFFPSAVYCDQR